MIKIFGIGNIILGDDGIGVLVSEWLIKNCSKEFEEVEIIIGGIDYLYCLDNINHGDVVIIIDSTYLGKEPSSVRLITLEELDEILEKNYIYKQDTLVSILRRENTDIKGYLIGVEIEKIDYSLELSKKLSDRFDDVCIEISQIILNIIK